MSYLDSLPEFNNKAILVQSTLGYQMAMAYLGYRDVGLENLESGSYLLGDFEDNNGPFNNVQLASPNESLFDSLSDEITWYNQLLGVANDTNQSEDTRLKCLTELVDQARLNEVPLLPYNPVITPQTNIPPSALVIHNETTGVEGVGFLHIGPVELALIYSARQSFDSFAQITGVYTDNASLVGGFATKEDLITPSGDAAQFWNGNKTFSAISFSQLASTPTTLAGYGISASDNLFDNKYLQLGSQLQTLNTTSGTPLTTTTTVIEGFGRLQNQVSARELSLGNPAVNGYVLSSTTAGVRSWIPAPTGTAVTGISLTGTNGITGAVVITAGNAVITAGTNITGMLKGNGTAISAATEMTDYIGITGAADGDTIVYDGTAGVATWAPGLSNPMDTLGDMIIGGALGATTKLAGNTTVTNKFLRSTGVSGLATAPSWQALVAGDIPDILISQVTNLQNTLDGYLPDALANNMIFIGNSISNVAVNAIVAGDLTAAYVINSGTNEAQFTIGNKKVTYAKIQDVTSQAILGRFALADGEVQQLSLSADFVINSGSGVIGLATPTPPLLTAKGDILTRTGAATVALNIGGSATFFMADPAATTGNKWVAMSGDATIATSGALTIAAGAVTLAKMANMATASFIGRTTAGTGVPEILTATQATAMLNLFSTSATTKGLVPGSNSVGATYYLDATGSWSVPAGGGGSGTVTSIATAGLISGGTITTTGTITTSMATNKLVGRGTAGTGIMEEITLGTGLSLTGTTLNATGGGSGTVNSGTQYQLAYYATNGTAVSGLTLLTATRALVSDANGLPVASTVSTTQLQYLASATGTTGTTSTNLVFSTSPTLTTPDIGAATATSINKVAITAPATSATLTLADGSTFATSGAFSTTLTATAITTLTLPTTGTLATLSGTETFANKTLNGPKIGTASGSGHFHMHYANSVPTGLADYITVFGGVAPKKLGFRFETDGFESYFQFDATATSKTYTFPDASGTVTLNPMTTLGDIIYGGTVVGGIAPPTRLGIGTTNQVLAVSAGGIPEWKTIAAGGDVTGPASSVDGNFAVFDSTTGKIIKESAGASLSAAGAAVFNTSVTVGVSTSTPGQLIFRNATTSATTIFQSSTSQSANLNYTWPSTAPAAGNILSSDISGNLSWTAAGAGNMVLATAGQVVTGSKIYADGTLLIRNPATTFSTILSTGASTGSWTVTFPNASGTAAFIGLAQTFSAAQTFQAGISLTTAGAFTTAAAVPSTFSGAATFNGLTTSTNTVSISAAGSFTNAQLAIGGGSIQWMSFGAATTGAPTQISSTRSGGTKVVLFAGTGSALDSALGVESAGMWLSSSQAIRFYTNSSTTVRAVIDSAGLTLSQAGSGVLIKEGTNATMGVATLVGGTVTVSTTKVTANSRIFLSVQTAGGTQGLLRISARTAATSFTITSFSALDTSTVAWVILEPAP